MHLRPKKTPPPPDPRLARHLPHHIRILQKESSKQKVSKWKQTGVKQTMEKSGAVLKKKTLSLLSHGSDPGDALGRS